MEIFIMKDLKNQTIEKTSIKESFSHHSEVSTSWIIYEWTKKTQILGV